MTPADQARTLLEGLGLAATAVDLGETMRPAAAAYDGSRADAPPGISQVAVSLGSLPRLSVDLSSASLADIPDAPGDLVVEEVLGEGGMGRVFLASQRSLGRKVALKTVRDPSDARQVAALLAEGAVAGSLDHPHVLPVHMLGFDATGRPVLVMKRIVGASWADLLADPSHPLWERALFLERDRLVAHLRILMRVAEAIHFAHERGVIHRDIKPENVMIGESGEVYVVDWGIAAKPANGQRAGLVGTPQHLAPEMATGDYLGPETDVYLLGATLHLILTGRPRHAGSTLLEVLGSALSSSPVDYPPEVPHALGAIANEATRPDPKARTASAAAFRMQLADYLSHRVALGLVAAAVERLEELRALRAEGRVDDPRTNQLAAEARFGLDQALHDKPDDARAKATREALLEELVSLELDRRNVPAARAWLGELAAPTPALAARVDQLAAELAAGERERARLAKLAEELDPSHLRRMSGYLAVASVIYGIGVWGAIETGALGPLTAGTVLGIGTSLLALTVLGVVLARRFMLRTTIARRITLGLVLMVAALWSHRLAGYLASASPLETLRGDLFILATGGGCLGAIGSRRWLVAGVAMALGGLLAAVWPALTAQVFTLSTSLAMLLMALELREPVERKGP